MSVARTIAEQMERASWIRRMFEIGARMKAERGERNVFDFTLGNPEVEPPARVLEVLRRVAADAPPHGHGYMPNAGFPAVRAKMAARLAAATGLPYTADHIIMTVGSAGACNTFLKAVLDPGDEVIVLFPYFPEYRFYIENHGGRMARVETDANFQPDIGRIAAAITPRTKAILLNSPNNPTGAVYGEGVLRELGALIDSLDHPVTVVSDEPYKAIAFNGAKVPETAALIGRTVTANSWSKAMAISGERIGYLAISPRLPEAGMLRDACTFTNRILGYINAPAIWQWVIAETADETVDVALYQRKRDIVCEALQRIGYEAPKPQGTFYVFPKSPIADDMAFIELLMREGILAVPGSGFGRSGYFRMSLTVPLETVERSIPGFERAYNRSLTVAAR
jgi:aspartate aminotransferase